MFAKGMLSELQRRELAKVGKNIAADLGLPYALAVTGDRVSGRYSRRLDLISGRVAVIENDRTLSLVPWRPTLEQLLGREVSGIMQESGVSWAFGRHRTGPAR